MDSNNIINMNLLHATFSNLEKTMQNRNDGDNQKIGKIATLIKDRFNVEFCRRVYIIINAEYKILPNRNRGMLESRIRIHFNNQVSAEEAGKILNIIVFNHEEISEEEDFLAKQVHANMGLSDEPDMGDEIENPSGKFGFDITNPIPVNGIDMIDDYFSKLRLITGELIAYSRTGSLVAENLPFPVDMYKIFNSERVQIATLYIYAYHGHMSGKAPDGFRLVNNG